MTHEWGVTTVGQRTTPPDFTGDEECLFRRPSIITFQYNLRPQEEPQRPPTATVSPKRVRHCTTEFESLFRKDRPRVVGVMSLGTGYKVIGVEGWCFQSRVQERYLYWSSPDIFIKYNSVYFWKCLGFGTLLIPYKRWYILSLYLFVFPHVSSRLEKDTDEVTRKFYSFGQLFVQIKKPKKRK